MEAGSIPLDLTVLAPVNIWNMFCHDKAFEGMHFDRTFVNWLKGLQQQFKNATDCKAEDQKAYQIHRKNFPRNTHDSLRCPNWFGPKAGQLLWTDLETGCYPITKPENLYYSREEYKISSLEVFQGHIYQSIKTSKFKHTLKAKDEDKKKASAAKEEKKKQKAAKQNAKERGIILDEAMVYLHSFLAILVLKCCITQSSLGWG